MAAAALTYTPRPGPPDSHGDHRITGHLVSTMCGYVGLGSWGGWLPTRDVSDIRIRIRGTSAYFFHIRIRIRVCDILNIRVRLRIRICGEIYIRIRIRTLQRMCGCGCVLCIAQPIDYRVIYRHAVTDSQSTA